MLDQIREQLQEGMHDYTLKTDEEIIKILCEFGSGETDFHTADVERLLKQKQWQEKRIKELEAYVIDTDRILDSGIEIMPESPHHERTKKLKSSI